MATIQYVVNAVDAASATFARIAGSADDVLHKLDEISGKSATAKLELKGDKEAELAIDKLDLKMANLGKKVAEGKIGVEGQARALVQIDALSLKLDEIGARHVTATVDVNVNRRSLRGLLSGGALSGLSPEGGGGGLAGLGGPLLGGGAVGGGLIAAGLVPSVAGLGLGGATGLGVIAGGLFGAAQGQKIATADLANIKALTTKLKGALGSQRKEISAELQAANKQYAKDAAFYAPFTALQGALKGLLQTILTPLRTVMTPLAGIITQFGKGLTGLGPQFAALFKASLPFIKQFLQFMLQAGKILLPAFTQAMNEMVKSGALKQMTDALVILTQGLATFIINLGPGMAASAQIFARLATFIGRALGFLGTAFSDIAKFLASDWSPGHLWNILLGSAKAFFGAIIGSAKAFGNRMSASFDALRHDIATIWDTIWRNTVTRAQNGIATVVAGFRSLRTLIGGVLSAMQGVISGAWNTIWRNTVTRVQNGITSVVSWFRGMPGRVVSALTGLGHSLGNFAAAALNEMWNGFKRIGSSITSWFSNFGKSIISVVKKVLGVFSPSSVFFDIGVNLMKGLKNGVEHGVGAAQKAAQVAAHRVANVGSGVQRWAPLVLQALRMEGLSPSLLHNVLYQMMTESGGNPNITNTWDINAQRGDPSRGLMQVIGGTFSAYHWPGTSWNILNPLANIAAALNYARHVYGPSLISGGMGIGSGHGYAAGGLITEPIWGIGASGRRYTFGERGPETVTPGTGRGDVTYNVTINVPHGANVAQIGREYVHAIREYERSSGSGWRR